MLSDRAWPYCLANSLLKFSSLALLRCKMTFKFSSLALLRCNRTFKFFELGFILVQKGLALLPCTSVPFRKKKIWSKKFKITFMMNFCISLQRTGLRISCEGAKKKSIPKLFWSRVELGTLARFPFVIFCFHCLIQIGTHWLLVIKRWKYENWQS